MPRRRLLAAAAAAAALASPACKRSSSGPRATAEVTMRVDGVAIEPLHLRQGETVVVAGGGHGDPAWVSARGRGTDGRFVTAALQRYPKGELRMVWPDADRAPTLTFHDGPGDTGRRLSEARGVQTIDLMTSRAIVARPDPVRTGLLVVGPGPGERTIAPDLIEELEASSIQTGQRRGANLVDLLTRSDIDPKSIVEIVLDQKNALPVKIPGPALRAANEMVVVRYNKRGELRIFHERSGNTVVDARNVTRMTLAGR